MIPSGGAISYVGGPTNATSRAITFTVGTDAESGVFEHVIQRRSAPLTAGTCGTWTGFSDISPINPASPWTDSTVADLTCYEYRLVVRDNVNNAATYTTAQTVKSDRTIPTGTISATPAGPSRGVISITGTGSDIGMGVQKVDVTYTGPANGNLCLNPPSPTSWSCTWTTTGVADGVYTLRLVVTDIATNASTLVTRTIMIDNTAPTASFNSFSELSNGQYMHAIGSTLYINTAQNGGFRVAIDATDPMSGVQQVVFPVHTGSWTGGLADTTGSPYEDDYTWSSGDTAPGIVNAVVSDAAGNTRNVPYTITADTTAPAGGTLTYLDDYTNVASIDLTFTNGTDAQSGIEHTHMQRREAPMVNGACGTWSPFGDVGPNNPASPFTDTTVSDGYCYQYQLQVFDNVQNIGVVPSAETVKLDTTAPTGTIGASPVGPVAGTQTISGTSDDTSSGVNTVVVKYASSVSSGTFGSCSGIATWSCTWNTTLLPDGLYTITLEVTDRSGNREASVISRTIVVDNNPPVMSFGSYTEVTNPGNMHAIGTTLYYRPTASGSFIVNINATDAGSGVNRVEFPDLNLTGTNWSTNGTDSTSPYAWQYSWSSGATAPTGTLATGVDQAGNSATTPFTLLADSTSPAGGTISYVDGYMNGPSRVISFTPGTDTQSGYDRHYLQRRQAVLNGGTCGAWSVWGSIGAESESSPYDDASIQDGYCYEYRVLTHDKVDNSQVFTSANTVRVDRTAPTGSISPNPIGPVPGTQTISGTSADTTSGIAGVVVKYSGASVGTYTGCSGTTTWSCTWNTTLVPDGTYTITLEVTDLAGNREAAAITRTIVVDNNPPIVGFSSFTEGTNANYQYATGSTIYYNPDFSGDFRVNISATDAGSGVNRVAFPNFNATGSGWSAAGSDLVGSPLYDWSYSWTPTATAPTATVATGFDNAGNSATTPFTVLADNTAPIGGSLTYTPVGPTNATQVELTYTPSNDADAGYDRHQLQRRQAVLSGNACATFGPWGNMAAISVSRLVALAISR